MECYLVDCLKVDKYSTFSFGTNKYSVPDYLVGRMVEIKAYANQLKVYYNNLQVCRHERQYGMYQWEIDLEHYLKTFARKPGALAGSVAMQQAPPEIRRLYERFFRSNPRGFIDILQYCHSKNIPHQKLEETVHELNWLCPQDVSPDKVIALLGNQSLELKPLAEPVRENEIEDYSREQLLEISMMVSNPE
jgi:hypothetical protein